MLNRLVAATVVAITSFALATSWVIAAPILRTATLITPGTTRTLTLPEPADNSNVISLGTAVDPGTGKVVDGIAIIHKKQTPAQVQQKGKPSSSCYTYLADGAKWKTVEPWVVNPANNAGIGASSPNAVLTILGGAINKWEDATDGVVGNEGSLDVLGSGTATSSALVADTISPDNKNEVYFADISDANAIAVTIVWGIFRGPPAGRELVEWDQVYDDVTFDWSAQSTGIAGKMDFDNIATHELGHSVGMGDLYNSCTEETMYGYSATAETKKRDLNTGDILGVDRLY